MKLEQEQIKKIALSVLLLIALLYGYFTYLLGPLQQSEKNATNGIAAVIPQISDAKTQIAKTAELETKAPQATAFLTQPQEHHPGRGADCMVPAEDGRFFPGRTGSRNARRSWFPKGADAMPGFRKLVWAIDVPKVEFVPLGMAISCLENDEPLLTILNVSIDATREDAQYQHATLILTTLVKS